MTRRAHPGVDDVLGRHGGAAEVLPGNGDVAAGQDVVQRGVLQGGVPDQRGRPRGGHLRGAVGRGQGLQALALAETGALPSFGHTDAGAGLLAEAVAEAGAALAGPGARSRRPTITHLFNGMRPLHHRDPGPVAASLSAAARGEAVVELVADGVHLAPATIRMVFDLLGPAAIALVTDAMAAAGMPDGLYPLGSVAVHVNGGVARLKAGGALAGGTAHLLDLVRTAVASGVSLADAVTAASATPATVLGRTDIGALETGRRADLVEVDDDLRPLRVMRAGAWVSGGTARPCRPSGWPIRLP